MAEEVGRLRELAVPASMRLVEEEAVQADQRCRLMLVLGVEAVVASLRLQRSKPGRKNLWEVAAEELHWSVQEAEAGQRICVCLRTAAGH